MRRSWCFILTACLLTLGMGTVVAQDTEAPTDVRVIELEADAALRFMQGGEQIFDIPVVPGETVVLRIANTVGFDHSFYIGTDSELSVPYATTELGIPPWSSGMRELVWAVPSDLTGLRFGCTVPGHYPLMQGCFSEARVGPTGTAERVGESSSCLRPEPPLVVDPMPASERPSERVEVRWAGVAVTFPDTWEAEGEPAPATDAEPWADVLTAYDSSGLGAAVCFAYVDDMDTYDWTTALELSDASLEAGGRQVARFDSVIPLRGQNLYSARYHFDRPGGVFTLECSSSDPPPEDHWLSIARTIEFLPEEG